MIGLRQMAGVFLFCGEKWLFLEKPAEARFLAGLLVPVGGHMEAGEMNAPQEALLREIREETGLGGEDISGLALRYVMLRIKGAEIRIQYIYFGEARHDRVRESGEGKLVWVDGEALQRMPVTATTRELLAHYAAHRDSPHVYVGTMRSEDGEPAVTWALLEDWETG